MEPQQDPLYQIFRKQLSEALLTEEASEENLIQQIIREYMDLLNGRGFVPARLMKYLEQDAREEVTEMLRKTTYGHFSFIEYHRQSGRLVEKLKTRGS